jgi:hypothetical protein
VGEVLNGATRLSYIFAFVPQMMVWGCGTLVARELAQRRGGGRLRVILLGAALSVAVELLILQTSVAPLPWLETAGIPAYDRIGGINWLWFVYMLGYEIVWVVLVPILIVELLFPDRRAEPWLRARGLVVASTIFMAGSLGLWALWTRIVVPQTFNMPVYDPPKSTLVLAALACAVLAACAYALPARPAVATSGSGHAPWPALVAVGAMGLGLPWWGLILLVFVPRVGLPLPVPLLAAGAWAALTWVVLARWSNAPDWSGQHRWALAFGALLASMLAGFLGSQFWPRIDLIAKIVMNVVAVACMLRLRAGVDNQRFLHRVTRVG